MSIAIEITVGAVMAFASFSFQQLGSCPAGTRQANSIHLCLNPLCVRGPLAAPAPAHCSHSLDTANSRRRAQSSMLASLSASSLICEQPPQAASEAMQQQATPPVNSPAFFDSLQGVLFDIDGTLCNSDPLHFQAFQELLVKQGFNNGIPIDEAFFRKHISGRHNPVIAAELFPDQPETWRVAFYEEKEERYRQLAGTALQRLAGLSELISWLESRHIPCAAVTNAPRANTELMLGSLKLDTWFKAVVLGEECTRAKPYPDPYLAGLTAIGLEGKADRVVVFEDSPAGIQAARAAGLRVVALRTGQTDAALAQAGATVIVDDFRDVLKWLPA